MSENDGLDFDDGGRATGTPQREVLKQKEATPPPFDIGAALQEIASIEDELASMDTGRLTKRREELKAAIKEAMVRNNIERSVDEVSGYTAEIQVRTSEQWDLEAFRASVGPKPAKKFIKTQEYLDPEAVKAAIKVGTLSRARLEVDGVVTKVLGSLALYVRPPEKK